MTCIHSLAVRVIEQVHVICSHTDVCKEVPATMINLPHVTYIIICIWVYPALCIVFV